MPTRSSSASGTSPTSRPRSREAHRVLKRGGRFYCMEFSSSDWPGFSTLYEAFASQRHPAHRQGRRGRRGQLPLSGRKHPPLPAPAAFKAMVARSRLRPRRGRADARRAGDHPLGLEDLTTCVTHLWRLLKWGRTLARHGALRGIEERSASRRRRCAGWRGSPASARASRRRPIMPTALSGDRPGRDQARPGAVDPARPGRREGRGESVAAPGRPAARAVREDQADDREPRSARRSTASIPEFDEVPVGAASIAQVHRAVTTEGREVAVKVLRPHIEEEFARAIETYEWAAAHVERYGGEAAAAAARAWSSPISGNGPRASSTSSARPPRPPSCARIWSPSPAITCPRSTGAAPRGGC